MQIKSIPLAITIFVVLFGGIAVSTAMNWWQTESTKIPSVYTEGEAAGEYNPADIRGSYTFGDINKNFGVPLADLQAAFRIPEGQDIAAVKVNSLETLFEDLPVEMGTGSVRLFTAFYKGLPYDLAVNGDTFLFPEAAAILQANGTMTAEQAEFLSTHILTDSPEQAVTPEPPPAAAGEQNPTPEAAATEHTAPVGSVTGKTTFQNLLEWGMTREAIESVLGGPMPDGTMLVKDYATANGLEFSTLKTEIQAQLDAAIK